MKKQKVLSVMLAVLMLLPVFSGLSLAAAAPSIGFVTVSFEDFGDREFLYDMSEDDLCHPDPYGVIFEASPVEIFAGDTLADAVVRWLEENNVEYDASFTYGFAVNAISFTDGAGNFVEDFGGGSITPDDDYLAPFSGWMVQVNNNFGSGLSYYDAEDGDIVRFVYTCEMGADISGDFYHPSAAIVGLEAYEAYGVLSPAFSEDVDAYTLSVGADVSAVKIGAVLENYQAVTKYEADGVEYKYLREIPVENGTVITISTEAYRYDNITYEVIEVLTDTVTVTVEKEDAGEAEPLSFFERVRVFLETLLDIVRGFFRVLSEFLSK